MIIMRGQYRQQQARIHQWSNDWISADVLDDLGRTVAQSVFLSPLSVSLSPAEIERLESDRARESVGRFWLNYQVRWEPDRSSARLVRLRPSTMT